jgi:glycosyltransferase involved in cell wall biosynthesis
VTTVHVVVPEGIDDPARPSGGNRYDRRILAGLAAGGWTVLELVAPGPWPRRDDAALAVLAAEVAAVPDGGLLLVDGLIASAAPDVLVPESRRLRLTVLVHMPLGDVEVPAAAEHATLAHAAGVVATSDWSRAELLTRYALDPGRVAVARPGADRGRPARGTTGGDRLLCVGALAPHKGQDVLVQALAELAGRRWRCTLVGPLDRDPAFVDRLQQRIEKAGLRHRVTRTGPRGGAQLGNRYAAADLLVLPSRLEAYGMVVTEALAAGVPVLASAVGGVPEALGTTSRGVPGLLVPASDPAALAGALGRWLDEAALRDRLRAAARERRDHLEGWTATTERIARALGAAADAEPERSRPRVPR